MTAKYLSIRNAQQVIDHLPDREATRLAAMQRARQKEVPGIHRERG